MPKRSKRLTEPSATPLKKYKRNQGSHHIEKLSDEDQFGKNALHNTRIKKKCLKLLNLKALFEFSTLQLAILTQDLTLVTTCLTFGADLNHKNFVGQTAVHSAIRDENPSSAGKILHLLLSNKADVNALDCKRQTPLHYACRTSCIGLIKQLLENGAHVSARDIEGRTPLQVALNEHFRHAAAATLLLMHGVEEDLNACDAEGNTFMHHAVVGSLGSDTTLPLQLITTLVRKGANISAQNELGQTPLHLASEEENEDVAIALLEAGAFNDVDVQDFSDRTPLHVAATNPYPQSCQLLHTMLNKYWGSIDIMDIEGNTPLDLAIEDTDNCTQKLVIFEEHVFKLKCINHVPRLSYEFDFSHLDSKILSTKAQCMEEIERMKSIKSERHTLFDLLCNRQDPIHLNDPKLVKKCKSIITSSNLTKKFPIFGQQISKTYYESESRLKLLNKAEECMTQPALPELRRMVLIYLTNRDLENVVQAFSI